MHDVTSFGGVVLVWGLVGTAALLARRVARWIGIPAPAVFLLAAAVAANSIKSASHRGRPARGRERGDAGPDRHSFRRRAASRTTAIPCRRGADRRPRSARHLRHDGTDRGRLPHRSSVLTGNSPRSSGPRWHRQIRLSSSLSLRTKNSRAGRRRYSKASRDSTTRPASHCCSASCNSRRTNTGRSQRCSETSRSRWPSGVPSASQAASPCDGCSAIGVRP